MENYAASGNPKPDADKALQDKVVLQDECGDTLWDEVLAQESKTSTLKNIAGINSKTSSPDSTQEVHSPKTE